MFDMTSLAALAVKVLVSLLTKAADKGAETASERSVGGLLDLLRRKLRDRGALGALTALQNKPECPQLQKLLCDALASALAVHPELAHETGKIIGAPVQDATVTGGGTIIQVQGSRNVIR
jgi:hypothetical protein